jgi:16S rRNA (guanine527-N7)-methyltransferase
MSDDGLVEALAESQRRGFLGPGPIEDHVHHSRAFVAVLETLGAAGSETVLDLGSGGGAPGLVLCRAPELAAATLTLVDASQGRTQFLLEAVDALACADRVEVVRGRAEELAHRPALREAHDVVVARSFGPPAVTAENATGFIRPGGWLIVSEPPTDQDRWSHPTELGELALALGERVSISLRSSGTATFQTLRRLAGLADRFPRRTGVPAKRPLF